MDEGTLIAARYVVKRLLGGGGIADVYLARDNLLGEDVALKVLHPHLRDSAAVVDAFRREVAISRLLEHRAVVRIHDLGRDEGTGVVYLAMEYLSGGDVRSRLLRSGALEPAEVRRVGTEVLGALAAAHGLGIIHRDLKPHNILMDAQGGCRLADFGLARCGALLGLEGGLHVAGTPEYLAPESAESGYADARSDVYSLGVVLYELATGRLPFRAGSPYELVRMHAEDTPEPPSGLRPGIPAGMEDAILRALEKDPSRRFQTAEDFAAALESGEVRALPAGGETHSCPGCGESVPDGFPYCFSCRREPLYLAPLGATPRRAAPRFRVVVTGPGKPGDQLGHEQRQHILLVLKDLAADTRRLERHLPRVPFVVLGELDGDGARELAERLSARGLQTMVVGAGSNEARGFFVRKDLLLAGRIVGIGLASYSGVFSGIGRGITGGGPIGLLLALPALALLAAPLVVAIRNRLPAVRWRQVNPRAALRRYLQLAPLVTSPTLQSLMRRVILRLQDLRQLAVQASAGEEVADAAEALVLEAADWIETCQLLEDRLGDERPLYRRVADMRGQDGEEGGRAAIAAAQRTIDARRELERSRQILLDRLLAFSARLDRLWVTLGSLGAHRATEDVRELTRAAEEAVVAVRAVREVEGSPPGGGGAA